MNFDMEKQQGLIPEIEKFKEERPDVQNNYARFLSDYALYQDTARRLKVDEPDVPTAQYRMHV